MLNIGFIGFGEAASQISIGLSENKNARIYAYDILLNDEEKRPILQERASSCDVFLSASLADLARKAEVIFSTVPCSFADQVANEICPYLKKTHIYVDLNAITPGISKKIAAVIEKAGVIFIDGAMMGSLKSRKHEIPTLVSGRGVDILMNKIAPLGMNYQFVGERPGTASATKLIRSLFTKGLAVLLIETLICANKLDSYDVVLNSMITTLKAEPADLINRLVTGTLLHSRRRLDELSGSREMLKQARIDSGMIEAIIGVFEKIDSLGFDKQSITKEAESSIEMLSSYYLTK